MEWIKFKNWVETIPNELRMPSYYQLVLRIPSTEDVNHWATPMKRILDNCSFPFCLAFFCLPQFPNIASADMSRDVYLFIYYKIMNNSYFTEDCCVSWLDYSILFIQVDRQVLSICIYVCRIPSFPNKAVVNNTIQKLNMHLFPFSSTQCFFTNTCSWFLDYFYLYNQWLQTAKPSQYNIRKEGIKDAKNCTFLATKVQQGLDFFLSLQKGNTLLFIKYFYSCTCQDYPGNN